MQGLLLWLQIEGMGDLLDAVALTGFGITAEPHFNMPVAVSQQLSQKRCSDLFFCSHRCCQRLSTCSNLNTLYLQL
jgi:hypothetical protein